MKRHPHRRRSLRAFTLFEVVLAAAVMLLALAGMAQIVISGTEMLDVSKKQVIAAQIIHSEIDAVHQEDWTTVNGWAGTTTSLTINSLPELATLKNVASGFSLSRTTAYYSGRSDTVTITFTVSWKTSDRGRSYSRKGTTYFSKYGLTNTYARP